MSTEAVVKTGTRKIDDVLWEFSLEVGSNKVTAKGGYKDDYPNWMARCPLPGSAHPDIPALLLKSINSKREEGDKIYVNLGYECNNPEAQYPGRTPGKIKRYHVEPSMTEEPILTNDFFKDLTSDDKHVLQKLMESGRDPSDFAAAQIHTAADPAAFTTAINLIEKGVESYRHVGMVWVEKFTTNNLEDIEKDKILKTVDAPPGLPAGLKNDDRDWLRLVPTVNPHDDGETWDIENRWEESLPGKWQSDFYPAAGA